VDCSRGPGPTRRVRTQDPISLRPEIARLEGEEATPGAWEAYRWIPRAVTFIYAPCFAAVPATKCGHCYPPHGDMRCHGSRYGGPDGPSYPAPRPPRSGGPGPSDRPSTTGSRADDGAQA